MKRESTPEPEQEDFEALLTRLEEVVQKMDSGGLSLEECMRLYEEGISKSDRLTAMLAEARDRILRLVTGEAGDTSLEPFDGEERS